MAKRISYFILGISLAFALGLLSSCAEQKTEPSPDVDRSTITQEEKDALYEEYLELQKYGPNFMKEADFIYYQDLVLGTDAYQEMLVNMLGTEKYIAYKEENPDTKIKIQDYIDVNREALLAEFKASVVDDPIYAERQELVEQHREALRAFKAPQNDM